MKAATEPMPIRATIDDFFTVYDAVLAKHKGYEVIVRIGGQSHHNGSSILQEDLYADHDEFRKGLSIGI